jgi:processive 1,2-diacylglycerol beta-glucosyltransferase
VRVLIFSADIGEGHDLPARVIRDAILERDPDADVTILDTIDAAGRVARVVVRSGSETVLTKLPWLFDVQYLLITRFAPTRALFGWLVRAIATPGMRRAVVRHAPDVLVATYPGANEILSQLRLRGALDVPVVSAVTDLAALRYWAHPGCDLHLVIHPESTTEIREIAGPGARVEAVRGLTAPQYDEPLERAEARAALGLPADAPIVAVSGGGWGVGDAGGAIEATLDARPDAHAVALCGRNENARTALEWAFAGNPRVHVLGFTDRMSEHLAAADVLVHSTAGLTAFEALVRGTRVISYGWAVGHIRANNEAYVRFGLADVATDRTGLKAAITRALASPQRPDLAYGSRPNAAERILAVAAGALLEAGDRTRGAEQAASA